MAESQDTAEAVFRMGLFGPASFNVGGRELRFKSLKLRAALGYIALNESLTETRERLVGLLWSESPEELARASLRQNVREFRVALQGVSRTGVYIAPHEIGFERGAIDVDVWAVTRAAEAGQIHPLLLERPNLADDLLAGLEDLDPSFRSWLLAKRHTIRDRLLRALETALGDESGDLAAQGNVAQAILNLDPTHEEAVRRLMRSRAMRGDTAAALRVYKALWDLLDDDYGMEPAEATQKLVADIKSGLLEPPRQIEVPAAQTEAVAPVVPGPGREAARRLWLSVQNATLRDIDPDKLHLVMEFRQHLIGSLLRFREWQVTDPPTAATAAESRRRSAAHYDVQIVAFQSDQTLHILITLKDLDSNTYIWSENFELKLESWVSHQRRAVRRIAMGLNVHLSAERLRRFSGESNVSLALYDRWLRCQTLVRTFSLKHWASLCQEFADIIAEASDFAPAYAGLADLHNIKHIVYPGVVRTREREQIALTHARRAIQLDPSEPQAHRSLAWSLIMAKHYEQGAVHSDVAYELNPYDSWLVITVALMRAFGGQPDHATELAKVAMDMTLAPSERHWLYQTDIQFLAGNYEAAIMASDNARGPTAIAWRCAAMAHLGRLKEATADAARFVAAIRANWHGIGPPTEEAIVEWFLHLYPLSRRGDWERLRDGLARAGLATGLAAYEQW